MRWLTRRRLRHDFSQRLASRLAYRIVSLVSVLTLGLSPAAHATLIDNLDGTITDGDVNLSWMKDANYAASTGFHPTGHMDWFEAQDFVAAVNTGLVDNFGFTDWRLPTAVNFDGTGPCISLNGTDPRCSESELGHLYFSELGNPGGETFPITGPFITFDPVFYWTSTESGILAHDFGFVLGIQANQLKSNDNRVLLVRDTAVQAPEPSSLLFLSVGLAGVSCLAWRQVGWRNRTAKRRIREAKQGGRVDMAHVSWRNRLLV